MRPRKCRWAHQTRLLSNRYRRRRIREPRFRRDLPVTFASGTAERAPRRSKHGRTTLAGRGHTCGPAPCRRLWRWESHAWQLLPVTTNIASPIVCSVDAGSASVQLVIHRSRVCKLLYVLRTLYKEDRRTIFLRHYTCRCHLPSSPTAMSNADLISFVNGCPRNLTVLHDVSDP